MADNNGNGTYKRRLAQVELLIICVLIFCTITILSAAFGFLDCGVAKEISLVALGILGGAVSSNVTGGQRKSDTEVKPTEVKPDGKQ